MKIAVRGGGTAGFIAAAHLSQRFAHAELFHIFSSSIPTIGVGEGTTPRFPLWLKETAGLTLPDLAARCGATLKRGTRFEGWGEGGAPFLNRFQPTRLIGYHFDAAEVVNVISEHVRGERIDARVDALVTTPEAAVVQLADGRQIACDYVLDARGFPSRETLASDEVIPLSWIPTGRAVLRRIPASAPTGVTRAIARPHGWIFQIPLRDWTSCGYIFNPVISADAQIEADFDAFLNSEQVDTFEPRGALDFPNFLRRTLFDGRVFSIGNAASFLEPLEATAIGTAIVEIRAAQEWIEEHRGQPAPEELAGFNASMRAYVLRNSLFVAWHYACGARWDTPFWRDARHRLERARTHPEAARHLAAMAPFVEAGRGLAGLNMAVEDEDRWNREVLPRLTQFVPYGNFSELNFAQVGHGIGYYQSHRQAARAADVQMHG
ncbi:MAG: tryptophan 7-halogenase [Pseudomonadota bacterium]